MSEKIPSEPPLPASFGPLAGPPAGGLATRGTGVASTEGLAGVTAGVSLWLFGLAWAISLGHQKFSEKTMLRMERGSGVGLIVLGLGQGAYLAVQLAKHMEHM